VCSYVIVQLVIPEYLTKCQQHTKLKNIEKDDA
jgi:hypothetical protein